MKKTKAEINPEHVNKIAELICGQWCMLPTIMSKLKLTEGQVRDVLIDIKKREELHEGEIVRGKHGVVSAYKTDKSIFD